MKVIWAVLCLNSVIDRQTNNLSLFNILEEISVLPVPAQGPQSKGPGDLTFAPTFELVTLWGRSDENVPERGYGRVKLSLPASSSEAPKVAVEYEVDLTKYLRLRQIGRIHGLPAAGEGVYTYTFIIEGKNEGQDWSPKFELPLRVVFQTTVA